MKDKLRNSRTLIRIDENIYTSRTLEEASSLNLRPLQERIGIKPTSTSQQHKLSDKIRVAVNYQKIAELPNKRLQFYKKHAALVQKTLKKPLFQRFAHRMLKREHIEEHGIKDVQVRVLPRLKDNGNPLAGTCKKRGKRGKILIYPKRRDSHRKTNIEIREGISVSLHQE